MAGGRRRQQQQREGMHAGPPAADDSATSDDGNGHSSRISQRLQFAIGRTNSMRALMLARRLTTIDPMTGSHPMALALKQ